MENDKALICLAAAAFGVGVYYGRKNKKSQSATSITLNREAMLLKRELKDFAARASRDPNMTEALYQRELNERIDFLNIINNM